MGMQQLPGQDGVFLAIQEFYSPNNSKDAKLVLLYPIKKNTWEKITVCKMPFLHRFGIMERNKKRYLLACCLKSHHEYKEDWRFPGATYWAQLPDDLSEIVKRKELKLHWNLLKDGMMRNHGYGLFVENGIESALIACDSGIYQAIPPVNPQESWEVRHLIREASSDAVLLDFDGDGDLEIGSFSPFHGDFLYIYKKDTEGVYQKILTYPVPCEMLHATWSGQILGRSVWIIGHRKGKQESFLLYWEAGSYKTIVIDTNAGAANAFLLRNGSLVMTNREKDEIALYEFEE